MLYSVFISNSLDKSNLPDEDIFFAIARRMYKSGQFSGNFKNYHLELVFEPVGSDYWNYINMMNPEITEEFAILEVK